MGCEMLKSSRHYSVWLLVLVISAAGCVASIKSPMASQVSVCGKLYQPQSTVVTVREEPQWISGSEQDCPGPSLLSPQPKSHDGGKAGLSNALEVATAHLRGMPQFMPVGAKTANGPSGTLQNGGGAAAFPVVPALSMTAPGLSRSVPNGSVIATPMICAAGESALQTDVSFPRGRHDVSPAEREKLRQLQGRRISSLLIEGLTEVPGLSSSMVPLARARAESVQQVISEVAPPGVSVQQRIRAGCCTKNGEPGSAGHDEMGVSVTACLAALPAVKKGEGLSMAK